MFPIRSQQCAAELPPHSPNVCPVVLVADEQKPSAEPHDAVQFSRDRHHLMRKSGKPDLRVAPLAPATHGSRRALRALLTMRRRFLADRTRGSPGFRFAQPGLPDCDLSPRPLPLQPPNISTSN